MNILISEDTVFKVASHTNIKCCSAGECSLPSYPIHTRTPVWLSFALCLKFILILKKKPKCSFLLGSGN